MSSQIDIGPEIAKRLGEFARAEGLTVDELLKRVLDDLAPNQVPIVEPSVQDFERDLDLLAIDPAVSPSNYQGSYPRSDIYLDHD